MVPLQAAVGHFCLLLVLVSATQPISGGHFNPMVSMVMAIWGELRPTLLPWYVLAQCAGGVVGSSLQYSVLPESMQNKTFAAVQV